MSRDKTISEPREMHKELISIVIPNYNGEKTIAKCLNSVHQSNYKHVEVIVVDDASNDDSLRIIRQFPCVIVQSQHRVGAAEARNLGAQQARGKLLFFTDADCVLLPHTLDLVLSSMMAADHNTIIGGTYAPKAFDRGFFNDFQASFVHYFETKNATTPDYIATHAMAIWSDVFFRYQGFCQPDLPILEDVEYSHRLKRQGVSLTMSSSLLVQHIFNFNLWSSLRNAARKSMYWTMYSIRNKDVLSDSGTASMELKLNTCMSLAMLLISAKLISQADVVAMLLFGVLLGINICISHNFLSFMRKNHGYGFAIRATAYYFFVYPIGIWLGSSLGVLKTIFDPIFKPNTSAGVH